MSQPSQELKHAISAAMNLGGNTEVTDNQLHTISALVVRRKVCEEDITVFIGAYENIEALEQIYEGDDQSSDAERQESTQTIQIFKSNTKRVLDCVINSVDGENDLRKIVLLATTMMKQGTEDQKRCFIPIFSAIRKRLEILGNAHAPEGR
jgi:hypothetical protein